MEEEKVRALCLSSPQRGPLYSHLIRTKIEGIAGRGSKGGKLQTIECHKS